MATSYDWRNQSKEIKQMQCAKSAVSSWMLMHRHWRPLVSTSEQLLNKMPLYSVSIKISLKISFCIISCIYSKFCKMKKKDIYFYILYYYYLCYCSNCLSYPSLASHVVWGVMVCGRVLGKSTKQMQWIGFVAVMW